MFFQFNGTIHQSKLFFHSSEQKICQEVNLKWSNRHTVLLSSAVFLQIFSILQIFAEKSQYLATFLLKYLTNILQRENTLLKRWGPAPHCCSPRLRGTNLQDPPSKALILADRGKQSLNFELNTTSRPGLRNEVIVREVKTKNGFFFRWKTIFSRALYHFSALKLVSFVDFQLWNAAFLSRKVRNTFSDLLQSTLALHCSHITDLFIPC